MKPLYQSLITVWTLVIVDILCLSVVTTAQNKSSTFMVESGLKFPYTVINEKTANLNFSYSFNDSETSQGGWTIHVSLSNEKIAQLIGQTEVIVEEQHPSGNITVSISGELPGRTSLIFRGRKEYSLAQNLSNSGTSGSQTYDDVIFKLFVERREGPLDISFNVIVVLMVICTNIGLGCKVELDIVKENLRRPVAPLIGLFSQYVFMPLIAFTVAYNIPLDPGIALGFFALGCSPGGSASNAYAYLLDGNVSLSVTMTLVSTISAIALFPLWLFTLGQVVYKEGNLTIPFVNIFMSLLGLVIPVVIGLFLQRKYPKLAEKCVKAVKYFMAAFVVFILTVGIYANVYIFYLVSGEVLLAAALVPYLGFVLGGLTAWILRQDLGNIVTIAIETGIQNTGIPIFLLRLSLLGPDKDTSTVAPVISALFTPIPLIAAIAFVQIRRLLRRRREKAQRMNGGVKEHDQEEQGEHTEDTCVVYRASKNDEGEEGGVEENGAEDSGPKYVLVPSSNAERL